MTRERFLNINNLMAIRRCPYCKAIIDEGSEYCSNCGTQLLFPEDEYIQEEIPGEKIVEEEVPEEEDAEKSKNPSRKRKKKEKKQESEPDEIGEKDEPEKEEAVGEESLKTPAVERDEYFVENQEPAFGTEELEKAINPEEKEKEEIEKFLKSLKEDRDEWNGEIPPTDELPPWAEKIKDEKPEEEPDTLHPSPKEEGEEESKGYIEEVEEPAVDSVEEETEKEEKEEEIYQEETEEREEILKPMGLTPEDEVPEVTIPQDEVEEETEVEEEIEIEAEAADEEEKIEEELEEKIIPDTGMGLPEGVEQENLPFTDKSPGIFEQEEKSPPSKLFTWLKSRAFDVLFIGALWIVALHIASRMLSTNLFKLISVSAFPAIALYISLLAVYLFLFFLFLGQTLGDHLFPYEE